MSLSKIASVKAKCFIFIISTLIALVSYVVFYSIFSFNQISLLQYKLSNNTIRLHILANSNSQEDQAIKIYLRDKLIEYIKKNIDLNSDRKYILKQLNQNKTKIEQYAEIVLNEIGINYDIKVSVGKWFFPNRIYDSILFPAGVYDAVNIFIGKAEGKNWWCVVFPPLCFVDDVKVDIPNEAQIELKKGLSSKEFKIATSYSKDKIPIKLRLKIYEILKTRFYKEAWFKKLFM